MAPRRAADVNSLDDVAFRCHLYRRHDFPLPDWYASQMDGLDAWKTTLRCDCGTVKVIYCQPETMVVWSQHYEHADLYLLETGPASRQDLYKESLQRSHERLKGTGGTVRSLRGRGKKKASGE